MYVLRLNNHFKSEASSILEWKFNRLSSRSNSVRCFAYKRSIIKEHHQYTVQDSRRPTSKKTTQERRQEKMPITNRKLFELARAVKFQEDPSLLEFILERNNIRSQDNVDTLSIDLYIQGFLKLAIVKWRSVGCHIKKPSTVLTTTLTTTKTITIT